MIYALMVTATLAALIAGIACYALKVKNSYVVLLIQFLASWAGSYGIAYWMGKGVFTNAYIAGVSAILSVVIFGVLFLARKLLGPLNSRREGSWAKKLNSHPHNPGRHQKHTTHSQHS
ncbi:MAG: hypothetical protein EOP04_32105 [Proteobacteria bacterium]|nr:MAG: hypothetical protein EOP04_32105 [Pseudomonadota bacterium]